MKKMFLGLGLTLLLAGCSEEVTEEKPKEEPKAEVKKEEPKKEPTPEYYSIKPTPEEFTNTITTQLKELNDTAGGTWLATVDTKDNKTMIFLTSETAISFAENPDGTIEYAAVIVQDGSNADVIKLLDFTVANAVLMQAANPEETKENRASILLNELSFEGLDTREGLLKGKNTTLGENEYHLGYEENGNFLYLKVWNKSDPNH